MDVVFLACDIRSPYPPSSVPRPVAPLGAYTEIFTSCTCPRCCFWSGLYEYTLRYTMDIYHRRHQHRAGNPKSITTNQILHSN